jgi:acetyl esterase/lipase
VGQISSDNTIKLLIIVLSLIFTSKSKSNNLEKTYLSLQTPTSINLPSEKGLISLGNCQNNNKIVLFLHGGGWTTGSTKDHGEFIIELSKFGCVYSYNYTLGEGFYIPLKETFNVYKKLLDKYGNKNISLVGISAGATMVLQLLTMCKQTKTPFPKKIISISPLSDNQLPHYDNNRDWVPISRLKSLVKKNSENGKYMNDNPIFNTIIADYSNTCPIYIFSSGDEVLRKEHVQLYNKLHSNKDTKVQMVTFLGMFHCFNLFPKYLYEATLSINLISKICY